MACRICHITTAHPVRDSRIFYKECLSLLAAGYDVHLVAQAEKDDVIDGVYLHALPQRSGRAWRFGCLSWLALVKALRTGARIFHYHDPELILVGFLLRWVFGKAVIYDIHESIPRQILSKHWLPSPLRRIVAGIYRLCERCLCVGQRLVVANEFCMPDYPAGAYLVRNYPILPAVADDDTGEPEPSASDSNPVPKLVYVGGVSHIRGADLYVDLAAELVRRGRTFRMLIIGHDNDGSLDRLNDRVRKEGLEPYVTFTGRMDNRKALEQIRGASVGLCLLLPVPNYTVCLATKILEYMFHGVPVLASDFDCWRSYVEGAGAGRMVDPCNLEQVVTVCCQMLDDPEARRAMGARGRQAVRTRYNWQSECATLLSCYEALTP